MPIPAHWPAMLDAGFLERCQAILDAINWATDGDDIPSAIELVYLAVPDNWGAAGGDVDAIASCWALRAYSLRPPDGREVSSPVR